MSAPYACSRSAIWPGLDCVVIGGGVASRAARRRRSSSLTPPAAAAATSVQRARAITVATLDAHGVLGQGENYVRLSAAATVTARALGDKTTRNVERPGRSVR